MSLPLTPEQEEWFATATPNAVAANPCVRLYGPGPEDKRCKHCRLILRHSRYFKCQLRGVTHGPGTDHRANWPACGRFIQA